MKLKNLFALSIAAMLVLVGCKNNASGNSSTNTSEEPTTSTTDASTSDTSTTDSSSSSSSSSSEEGGGTQELNAAEKAALISTLNTFESITITFTQIIQKPKPPIPPMPPIPPEPKLIVAVCCAWTGCPSCSAGIQSGITITVRRASLSMI